MNTDEKQLQTPAPKPSKKEWITPAFESALINEQTENGGGITVDGASTGGPFVAPS